MLCNYNFMNVTKYGTYVEGYTNYYICAKFKSYKMASEMRKGQIPW